MAADQRRKRLNGASIVGCNSREQHKAKKKNVGLLQDYSDIKSHISLEWDGNQKMVVAKRDQIGISWSYARPFLDSTFNSHNILADVFSVPQEIYDLENLDDVLSYEAWQNHLSESERNHLMQFLPRGPEAEQVVQALLAGDNFDFGNPLIKWGASLCSGDFHPDAIFHREQCLRTDKKAYYKGLQKYHNDVIAYLLKLQETCSSCEDPEKEIVQKIWRSRNDVEKQISSHPNESRIGDLEGNATVTSESCSWVADEKPCSSENQISSVIKVGELWNRIREKGIRKEKGRNLLDGAPNVGARSSKGDKLTKRNIWNTDGSKYMSYVKISKKQYEIVKSMKQSGKSIQSRSLNEVLGDPDSFNVLPYEDFEEEEQEKLRQHWLQLANKDLPAAYANWIEFRLQRREMTKSVEKDMRKRLKSRTEGDEGDENHESMLQGEIDIEAANNESSMEDDVKFIPDLPQSDYCEPTYMEEDDKSPHKLTGASECNPTDNDSEENFTAGSANESEKLIITESDQSPPVVSEYVENLNTADTLVSQQPHLCASGDVWKAVSIPHPYYDSTGSRDYASFSELSLAHPQVNDDQGSHLVVLESDLPVGDTGKDLLQRQSENGSLSSFPNQDRNELLQSIFKGQSMLSYSHEQKHTGMDFQPPSSVFMGDDQFRGHFGVHQHQSLPLEQGQKRESEVYMQKNLSENIYSDGGRYLIPRQELLTPVNVHDWAVNGVRMPGPLQSHLEGGEMLSHKWFSGEHQVHGGWSASVGTSVTSQSIGSGNNADQSLFSVLSHCNQLRTSSPYQPVNSTEQFISPRNYGVVAGANPRIENILPQAAQSLDYLGGREAATSMMDDDMQWMNLPNQNPGLLDPMGKPFLRSWNQ